MTLARAARVDTGSEHHDCVDRTPTRAPATRSSGGLAAARDATGAVVGTILGIAPHALHHVGLIAGAALVTGTSGNVHFYLLGLVLSFPMLRRIRRRFRTPWAPTIAITGFTALFAVSAFVIGPALAGTDGRTPGPDPIVPIPTRPADHGSHH